MDYKNVNKPVNINLTIKELFWTCIYLKTRITTLNNTDTLSMDDDFMKDKGPLISSLCSDSVITEDLLVPVYSNDKEKMIQEIEWRNNLLKKLETYLSSSLE